LTNKLAISNIQPKLKAGYDHVKNNFSNRSSCVFPFLLTDTNDLVIVFLNYWKIKNNLKRITCNIRAHDESGVLVEFINFALIENHYKISIKSIIKNNLIKKGIVNIEFISPENMGFTFPAVTAFYTSNSNYSGVHTAGRIKNPEEKKIPGEIIETNWRCKWENGVTPFFSLFNGSIKSKSKVIKVTIYKPNKEIIISKEINLSLIEPFSNKIIFIDELFNLQKYKIDNNSYIEVNIPFTDFFPRMVCGNFFRKEKFLEVTHSFENQEENPDYLDELDLEKTPDRIPSINPIAINKELELELIFFPTNCKGKVIGSWRSGSKNKTLTKSDEIFEWISGGNSSELKKISIKSGDTIKALDITKGKIPTRINTNYIYRVKDTKSQYSTDIAAGQITEYFPPKKFTWGHGIIGKGYKTVIFLTSFSHDEKCRIESKGKLTLLVEDKVYEKNFTIPPDSGIEINLNDIIFNNYTSEEVYLISWYYVQEKKTKLMCYWISYTKDGKITGDHAF